MNANLSLMVERNSDKKRNNDKCWCECKAHHICEKDYIWNSATCSCKNGKYLTNIIDNLVITCQEIIETAKTLNFNEKKVTCKTEKLDFLLAFLSNTVELLIVVSIYCYLTNNWAKQINLMPYHVINNILKEVLY